jgi:hypothetical protein
MAKLKYIESPQKMWEYFKAYAKETKDNPRIKVDYVGKDGNRVDTPLERPLTLEGFNNWLANENIIEDAEHYFTNTNGTYNEYLGVCIRIRRSVKQDQIEGGMVGQYNPSITQRLNGLSEKSEVTVKEQPLFPDSND